LAADDKDAAIEHKEIGNFIERQHPG